MASGRVIVGHAFPTITEVLLDGQTALLASPDDERELKEKLARALSMGYPNVMAEKARQIALAEYSWKNRAAKILSVLKSPMGRVTSQN
jgi:glycosyltransferase involved in cell wall biosynthesis